PITPTPNGYKRILVTVNQGESKYDALQFNLNHNFTGKGQVLLSYTWSHTRNNFEPDATGGDPNDVNQLNKEWAHSLLNQPPRLHYPPTRGAAAGCARVAARSRGRGPLLRPRGGPLHSGAGAQKTGGGGGGPGRGPGGLRRPPHRGGGPHHPPPPLLPRLRLQ